MLNFAHVHTRARILLTVPDSAGSHPTSGPGSVRQFTQHGPHLTVTLVDHRCTTVVAVFWWHLCGPQFIPKSSSHLHYASNIDRES